MNKHHDHCDHEGPHSHSDRAHVHASSSTGALKLSIALNLVFVIIELYAGYVSDSLSLFGDAIHNLSDVCSLILVWLGVYLAQSVATKRFNFGFKKFSILVSFFNAVTLIGTSFYIIFEAISRFLNPQIQNSLMMIVVASIGFVINSATALLFHKDHLSDLNMKSAYLHLMGDALVSFGVALGGIIIYFKSWVYVDPILSVIIAVIILIGTWSLFKESIILLLNGVPQQVNFQKLEEFIASFPEVQQLSHLKVWALSTSEFALSAQLKVGDIKLFHFNDLQNKIRQDFKIQNITIQIN